MGNKEKKGYDYPELSAFCLQLATLLQAAVPLDEGLRIMAEDAASKEEKDRLTAMADDLECGDPLFQVMERTEAFPDYVIKMAKLGYETGTTDRIMSSLSVYYDKEDRMRRSIKNALTYPAMMLIMLLVVLFVLFTKVMPVFSEVYEQLGAELSPVSQTAIRLGGAFSGIALAAAALIGLLILILSTASRFGKKLHFLEDLLDRFKSSSKIAVTIARRRLCAVLAMTLHSGLDLDRGLELAKELAANKTVEDGIGRCEDALLDGLPYDEAMNRSGLFSGFQIQMIRVGNRSGQLDAMMERISENYEEEADGAIEGMISRLEPTIVAVLAVSVGLVLLSVMLPLVGVLSSIG